MFNSKNLQELVDCYHNSPEPSFKVSNYFPIYAELFQHLRGTACTFIEIGILEGGSLFMWRNWLGDKARIIGFDLNPGALKWQEYGFEIIIGDQGDPDFWKKTFAEIGGFEVLLDDGGHQSFQQIVTVSEAIKAAQNECLVVVEDTCTNYMKEFVNHHDHSFMAYAQAVSNNLLARSKSLWPNDFLPIQNQESILEYMKVHSVQFFSSIVAFKINPALAEFPKLIKNRPLKGTNDFRYQGKNSALVKWPDPFIKQDVLIEGGKAKR